MAGYHCPMPLASSFWRTLSDASGIFIRTDFRKISEFVRDLRVCPMLFPQFLNKSFEHVNLLLNFAISKLIKENKKQNINN